MKNTDKEQAIIKLFKEVDNFKMWAAKNYPECDENNDNGEWELSGDSDCNFYEMRDAAFIILSSIACQDANDKLIDNMLYTIARNNESEMLADEVINKYLDKALKTDLKYLIQNAEAILSNMC